jgi:glycosyltransferase involved in cell wall biosynthesis
MLSKKKDLLILIPALNEQKTIENIIKKLKKYGHILVIDDGSRDDTKFVANKNGATVIKHNTNRGYNEALNTGFKFFLKKKYKKVITIDADGQLPAKYVKIFNDKLNSNFEIICGVRSKVERFGEKFFLFFSKIIWNLNDPVCGLKGFSYSFLKKNFSHFKFDSINTELLIKGRKISSRINQVPIKNISRKDSSRFGEGIKANIIIITTLLKCLIFIK